MLYQLTVKKIIVLNEYYDLIQNKKGTIKAINFLSSVIFISNNMEEVKRLYNNIITGVN